jgi:hypothetical protein
VPPDFSLCCVEEQSSEKSPTHNSESREKCWASQYQESENWRYPLVIDSFFVPHVVCARATGKVHFVGFSFHFHHRGTTPDAPVKTSLTLNVLPNRQNRVLLLICGVWSLNGLFPHVRPDRREDDQHRKGKGQPQITAPFQNS